NVNKLYLIYKLDPGNETIMVCAVVCVVVIIFSVIVLYNIFQVGIIQKVQEYGKLKAIGATRKQMKQIIFREGMYLACIGIPLGLLLGIGVAKAVMDYFARDLGAGGYEIRRTGVTVVSV
ncbi:MAG: ABC transporter permease, partial [Lachnospiraceae bacterium]|nr:ABC transporter permease [Lachnospiraceae bacterium]